MAQGNVHIRGLKELRRDFRRISKDLDRKLTTALKKSAEPAADLAQTYALGRIHHMPRSPQWAAMRTGIIKQDVVYIAPQQRGGRRKWKGGSQFAAMMRERAMEPAVEGKADEVVVAIGNLIDDLADSNGF